jgi:plastocyanin
MSARPTFGAALAALAFAIAGCGGGGGGASSAPATSTQGPPSAGARSSLRLRADPSGALRFDKKTLAAKPGKVTIVMRNPAPVSHDISIEGPGINDHGEVVGQGGTSTVSATLKAGSYSFYCSVPGHRQAGMAGTLSVR